MPDLVKCRTPECTDWFLKRGRNEKHCDKCKKLRHRQQNAIASKAHRERNTTATTKGRAKSGIKAKVMAPRRKTTDAVSSADLMALPPEKWPVMFNRITGAEVMVVR